jgi:hypothetical protein
VTADAIGDVSMPTGERWHPQGKMIVTKYAGIAALGFMAWPVHVACYNGVVNLYGFVKTNDHGRALKT